jgi:hypothetical protein
VKVCSNSTCPHKGERQPIANFYVRSGVDAPTEIGHYNSHCKDCLKQHSKDIKRLAPDQPRTETEKIALDFFHRQGIFALPGKALAVAHCDVLCWGAVRVEVKHAVLTVHRTQKCFVFSSTPKQVQRGYLADIILLICEYSPTRRTFHLFHKNDPVFNINGHVKTGFMFRPGATEALRVIDGNVVMLQSMMDEAENNLTRLWDVFRVKSEALKHPSA